MSKRQGKRASLFPQSPAVNVSNKRAPYINDFINNEWKSYTEAEVIFNSCLLPVIVIGNLLVIIVVTKMSARSRKVSDILVASLAMADMCVGLYVLPLEIAMFVDMATVTRLPISTCFFEQSVYLQPLCWSIQNMCLIALECCIALMAPTFHRVWSTPRIAAFAVGGSLILGFGYTCITYVVLPTGLSRRECRNTISNNNIWISVYPITVFFLTFLLYLRIIHISISNGLKNPVMGNHRRKTLRKSKIMSLIFLIFAVCWLPISVVVIYEEFEQRFRLDNKVLTRSLLSLAHANSAINWFVYVMKSRRFRDLVKQIFKLKRNRVRPSR